jgi:hypothetical protein
MSREIKAIVLVGSPKGPMGSSYSLGMYLADELRAHGAAVQEISTHMCLKSARGPATLVNAASGADILALSFPLYIDALPAEVVRALELIVAARASNPAAKECRFLAITNCGFPESRHNDVALDMCRIFAKKAGMKWAGGLGLGGGASITGRRLAEAGGMFRNVSRALQIAAAALAECRDIPKEAFDLMRKPLAPVRMYILVSSIGWRRQAMKNGVWRGLAARPYKEAPSK